MAILKVDGNKLIRIYDYETLCIEPWGENGFRVRATKEAKINEENDWALLPNQNSSAQIVLDEQKSSIINGKIKAEIESCGKITFYNQNGKKLLEEYMRTMANANELCSPLMIYPREFTPHLGGSNYGLTMRFESDKNEKIFGMGQYQQDILNIKGCTLELAQRNSQATVPFMISNLGYGFLWNNPAIGKVCFGKNMTEWTVQSTKQLDYYIIAGDSPDEIEQSYANATGKVPMMPEYAMGFWQCKLRYRTQDEVLDVAREYKRRGLPLSVIVIDFFHWPNQGTWMFDKKYWPNPEAMVKELKEMGVELVVSVWPTVDSRAENYTEMIEKGMLVRTDRGTRTQIELFGNEVFADTTNPETREFLWNKVKKNYYDIGIKNFWLDVAEPEYSVYNFDNYRYYLGTNLEVGNIYPQMYSKCFYDGMKKEGQEDVINLVRCAWAGSQRYGALAWSGDVFSNFESMKDQLTAGLNMAIAGIPWYTTDIGGFRGGNIEDPNFRECLIRWFEYGAFCPVFRLHGDRSPSLESFTKELGGGMCGSGASNEVWSYGDEVYKITNKYMFIRERLKPYILVQMKAAHEKGIPPMRPIFYDFPDDKEAWNIEDQYMFGTDILVAPILNQGQRNRNVYLPKGVKWTNAYTKEVFEGGCVVKADAPIDIIPIFTKNDTKLSIFE